MHEMAVTQSILTITCQHAERANAARITDIHLVIGQLSSIVDDSIQFYWDFIAAGTLAEGATLHFERIPAQLTCNDCSHTFALTAGLMPCPICDSLNLSVTAGDEFYIASIDIEPHSEPTP